MIRKIKDILKPKPASNPYGLTDGQLARLKTHISRPEHKEFQDLLDVLCTLLAEGLLLESSNENLHFTRGYISGLRRAGTIVDEIIRMTEQKEHARTTRDVDRQRRTEDQRRLAAFGTGFWGARSGS